MRKYPVCADCLEEIDPVRYDDCEKYYLTEKGEPLCRDCFIKREKKFLELSTDDYADLIGVRVVALLRRQSWSRRRRSGLSPRRGSISRPTVWRT